jgi:hypothetical protein
VRAYRPLLILLVLFIATVLIVAVSRADDLTLNEGAKTITSTVTNKTEPNSPSMPAPAIHPTAPCMTGGGMGLSVPGGGASYGSGKVNEDCQRMEAARIFVGAGAIAFGFALLCTTKSVIDSGLASECPRRAD